MKCLIKTLLLLFFVFSFFQINIYSQNKSTKDYCKNLSKIKSIPIKPADARKTDKEYKEYFAIIKSGQAAIPCLIENITNTKEMNDPRCPSVGVIAVGDVSYFILQEIGKFDFISMFSPEIQKAYKNNGIFGYFEFIDENENRSKLQTKLKEWYSSKNQTNK